MIICNNTMNNPPNVDVFPLKLLDHDIIEWKRAKPGYESVSSSKSSSMARRERDEWNDDRTTRFRCTQPIPSAIGLFTKQMLDGKMFSHPDETATSLTRIIKKTQLNDTGLQLSLNFKPFDSTKANLDFETRRMKAKSPYKRRFLVPILQTIKVFNKMK